MALRIVENYERLPGQVPRLTQRYRVRIEAIWYPPKRRLKMVRTSKPIPVQIQDVSIGGALFESVNNPTIDVGRRIRFELDGRQGTAEVRNIRPSAEARSYYGVQFLSLSPPLQSEIDELVGSTRGGSHNDQAEQSTQS